MGPCWWSYAGHTLAPYCPNEPPPPLPGGGARSSCSVTTAGDQIKKSLKARRQRGNKVGEEITISARLGEWRGPLLSTICCRLPGELTTSLPHSSAADHQRAEEEVDHLPKVSSNSAHTLFLSSSTLNMTQQRQQSEDQTECEGA